MRILSYCFIVAFAIFLQPSAAPAANSAGTEAGPLALLKSRQYAKLDRYFAGRQALYESGAISDEVLYADFRALYEEGAQNEPYFNEWVQAFPKSYAARTARGAYYYRMAWFVRGEKFVAETPPQQLKQMSEFAGLARPDLMASLQMTRKPYLSALYLLNVDMLSGSREARRHWLEQGNAIDPSNVLVRVRYMFSLQPRWGGSHSEMHAFREACEGEHVPARTLAKLDLVIGREIGDQGLSAADRYRLWGTMLELEKTAGEPPSVEAVMRRTRAAWDTGRREEANRGLEQLAQMHVDQAWALSQIGWMYTQERRLEEAWPVLLKAAELDDPWAQFAVGKTFYQGCPDIDVPADRGAGLKWIRRSAAQHFREAESFLSTARE
jgi:tetratricopeptide (TPR) repeat protein